jgi:hypothetical protein
MFFMDDPTGSINEPKDHFFQTLLEELVLLLDIAHQLVQRSKNMQSRKQKMPAMYVHRQKRILFGLTTSEKRDEHIFVPVPASFESESDGGFNVDVGALAAGVKAAKTQRNMWKIRFKKTKGMF